MTTPSDLDAGPDRSGLARQPRYVLLLAGGVALLGLAGAAVVAAGGEFGSTGGPDRLVGAATLCAATGCGLVAGGAVLGGVRLVVTLGRRVN
jgi:hypothetical protein